MPAPTVLFDSFGGAFPASWRFAGLREVLAAWRPEEVVPVIRAAERAAGAGGYAVGFVAYEAAGALNPELPTLPPLPDLPLAWFAVYSERREVAAGEGLPAEAPGSPQLVPAIAAEDYRSAVENIRGLIAAGDCYQVNYTFPLTGEFRGDPPAFYRALGLAQRAAFSAYLDIGDSVLVSASPELFFAVRNGTIVTRPMKGTAPRGRWPAEDQQLADGLRESAKERAENLMIVDLLRNDLGKIAATGSVTAEPLFAVESYPTLHQMTSTVSARLHEGPGFADILRALFPCGSVTGAPKRRSMAIIAETEASSRGVYCGTIGCLAPGGEMTFSVAIRTLTLAKATGRITLGVGSGITWDSAATAEYAEALTKAAFVDSGPPFRLIETMGRQNGIVSRQKQHLARLAASARRFGYPCDQARIESMLAELPVTPELQRVRLTLAADGALELTAEPCISDDRPIRVGVVRTARDPGDHLLYHKTDRRERLAAARAGRPECDEVLLVNNRDELTEGTYHNLVLRLDGVLVTPSLASGLLPGVLRGELLASGAIVERTLYPADLVRAEEIWLINSLRGWRRGEICKGDSICEVCC